MKSNMRNNFFVTFSRVVRRIVTQTQRLLNFMRKNAHHEYNARTLSRILKMGENKVKVYLNRLHNKGLILRVDKGMYKAVCDLAVVRGNQLENPPTLLHGILLECTIVRHVTKWGQGAPPQQKNCYVENGLEKWLESHEFAYRSDNHSWFRYVWWNGRRLTFTIFSTDKLHVYLSSTRNPISYDEFELLLSFLDGYFEEIAPFKDRRVVKLKEVGLAKDFKELRLEGVKSVSLRAFKNAWARIYYKDDQQATRVEHHGCYDMTLDEALKSLSVLTTPVNFEGIVLNPAANKKLDDYLDVA